MTAAKTCSSDTTFNLSFDTKSSTWNTQTTGVTFTTRVSVLRPPSLQAIRLDHAVRFYLSSLGFVCFRVDCFFCLVLFLNAVAYTIDVINFVLYPISLAMQIDWKLSNLPPIGFLLLFNFVAHITKKTSRRSCRNNYIYFNPMYTSWGLYPSKSVSVFFFIDETFDVTMNRFWN